MDHLLSFNVNLNPEKSNYPFRNQYLHVSCSTNNSSFFHYISDNRGFFIWKSPNADYQQTYEKLLENNFCAELLDHVQDNFEFIFFDLSKQTLIIGKDSLGLYSLVYTEDPFIISSHDLQGNEHPPGFTIFNNNSKSIIAYPQFTRNPDPSLTIESTMSHLMNTLIHSVIPGSPVLFSGGLDSTLIAAALALSGAPEVELINFCALDTAPDRASSRASLVDLQRSFPNTKFTLHEYTGDILEMANERSLIKSLLVPTSVTEMNLNIAMTLYSALKHSNSSIVHSGLGADELCCGYMRMKEGATADAEIVEHMNRLWTRNGGRDDRVAMHLGKVCICPFLSKKFIEAASKLPVEMLIKEDLPRGCGEKWILRKIAEKYGLKQAAERPKQAMQFGSKVAKAKWRGDEEIPES